jgi:hypothetical protein
MVVDSGIWGRRHVGRANVLARCDGFPLAPVAQAQRWACPGAEFAQASETGERTWPATGPQSQKEETMAGDAYGDGYEIGW